ncbi:isopentenyl-diphosphate delta-isomerase, fmn-dependent [hydrocarbon metagenome]|uniref:Isopentenyl-diphosphate delta-isomerase, fmn-dependent n=1 Tax=hydrocarbon metagenome TaxID=938273 RepID=A0A0W8E7R0_9ZZZZ
MVINAITGGTEQASRINQTLASIAARYQVAMAVGSQTAAIDDPGLRYTFSIVRECNPDGLVFANIAAGSGTSEALEAVAMINADALQIHFNIPQELAMSEGERSFRGILDRVQKIVENCHVPVIAKEVGFGLSRESIGRLYEAGIRIYDIGGKGGTNFISIEDQRSGKFMGELDQWGIPTAVSLMEAVSLDLPMQIIASGGIRTVADAAKAYALGADMVGIAGPFLRILLNHGPEELERKIEEMIYRLKAVFLMTGSCNLEQMKNQPLIISNETAQWIEARGIDRLRWSQR